MYAFVYNWVQVCVQCTINAFALLNRITINQLEMMPRTAEDIDCLSCGKPYEIKYPPFSNLFHRIVFRLMVMMNYNHL
jgi:hypothetical protein